VALGGGVLGEIDEVVNVKPDSEQVGGKVCGWVVWVA
jgi:hypothetical protein